jgi:hypothetical protein
VAHIELDTVQVVTVQDGAAQQRQGKDIEDSPQLIGHAAYPVASGAITSNRYLCEGDPTLRPYS